MTPTPWATGDAGAKSLSASGFFRNPGAPRRMDSNMPNLAHPTRPHSTRPRPTHPEPPTGPAVTMEQRA